MKIAVCHFNLEKTALEKKKSSYYSIPDISIKRDVI